MFGICVSYTFVKGDIGFVFELFVVGVSLCFGSRSRGCVTKRCDAKGQRRSFVVGAPPRFALRPRRITTTYLCYQGSEELSALLPRRDCCVFVVFGVFFVPCAR